jgi:hypothetical protein
MATHSNTIGIIAIAFSCLLTALDSGYGSSTTEEPSCEARKQDRDRGSAGAAAVNRKQGAQSAADPKQKPESAEEFAPSREGYTRFTPKRVNVEPGEEVVWCQWVAGPAEADQAILDITGKQPFLGHHAQLFATFDPQPVGTSIRCSGQGQAQMYRFGGGEGNGGAFPMGAALRLRKGESLLMNNHNSKTGVPT